MKTPRPPIVLMAGSIPVTVERAAVQRFLDERMERQAQAERGRG